ncbi:MAG: flagellar biosynthesis protein FlhB [Planctomycetes bacterium]|nr:flagellar biosynthesis protein FlhB [Planctomycetota bacterium]
MASDEFGDKTEEATDHRRQEAREKGNVAKSQDLNAAGHMIAAAFVLLMLGIPTIRSLAGLMQESLRGPAWRKVDQNFVMKVFWDRAEHIASVTMPILLVMMVTALFFNVVQVGFLISPDSLIPKLNRLDPIQGIKRLFSIQSTVKLFVSLSKLAVVTFIAALSISISLPRFLHLSDQEPPLNLYVIQQSIARLAFELAIALIVLALLDFAFQKWKQDRDLRMTKQEVREEMKKMEGDPLIRQRRKDAHRKLAQSREMQAVKNADLIVTNPTQIAVALKYDPETMMAPTVVAKGMGEIAAHIRRLAAEHGIPIIERKPLAQALYHDVKVGQLIPIEMYEVFVELMAYIYNISGRTPPNLS